MELMEHLLLEKAEKVDFIFCIFRKELVTLIYRIQLNDGTTNDIVADEAFVKYYCEKHGYTYEEVVEKVPPSDEERISALESAMLTMMGV